MSQLSDDLLNLQRLRDTYNGLRWTHAEERGREPLIRSANEPVEERRAREDAETTRQRAEEDAWSALLVAVRAWPPERWVRLSGTGYRVEETWVGGREGVIGSGYYTTEKRPVEVAGVVVPMQVQVHRNGFMHGAEVTLVFQWNRHPLYAELAEPSLEMEEVES